MLGLQAFMASASGICSPPMYDVGGILTDAQSASILLQGAKVTVTTRDGSEVLASVTAGYGTFVGRACPWAPGCSRPLTTAASPR